MRRNPGNKSEEMAQEQGHLLSQEIDNTSTSDLNDTRGRRPLCEHCEFFVVVVLAAILLVSLGLGAMFLVTRFLTNTALAIPPSGQVTSGGGGTGGTSSLKGEGGNWFGGLSAPPDDRPPCITGDSCASALLSLPAILPLTGGHSIEAKAEWRVRQISGDASMMKGLTSCAAYPPSSVHDDLRHCEKPVLSYGPPLFRFNELNYLWIAKSDWAYEALFNYSRESEWWSWLSNGESVYQKDPYEALEFDGIDTIALVYLNGRMILQSDNMFQRHLINVRDLLVTDQLNNLTIVVKDPMAYAREIAKGSPIDVSTMGLRNFLGGHRSNHTPPGGYESSDGFTQSTGERQWARKAQSDYGWDWGPAHVPAGIWKPARLITFQVGRVVSVSTRQVFLKNGSVELTATVYSELRSVCRTGPLSIELVVLAPQQFLDVADDSPSRDKDRGQRAQEERATPVPIVELAVARTIEGYEIKSTCTGEAAFSGGQEKLFEHATVFQLTIEKPQLWWPIGLSPTPGVLYPVEARLRQGFATQMSTIYHRYNRKIGLRHIRLERQQISSSADPTKRKVVPPSEVPDAWRAIKEAPGCYAAVLAMQAQAPGLDLCDAIQRIHMKQDEGNSYAFSDAAKCPSDGKTSALSLASGTSSPPLPFNTGETSSCVSPPQCPGTLLGCGTLKGDEAFYLTVNGVDVFMRGSNMIPFSPFHASVTTKDMLVVLDSALMGGHNMLRIWGGGVYPDDLVYDWADKNGIMIWQEFMFACSFYPTTATFLSSVRKEVRDQVKRLAHHPSIVIWGGNNENEEAFGWFGQGYRSSRDIPVVEYTTLFINTIEKELRSIVDPSTPYVDSSPSSGVLSDYPQLYRKRWGNPDDLRSGDIHYYNYGADCMSSSPPWPSARFVSEFGFQSIPSVLNHMNEATDQAHMATDLHFHSPLIEFKQRHGGGQSQIISRVQKQFSIPHIVRRLSESTEASHPTSCRLNSSAASKGVEKLRGLRDEESAVDSKALHPSSSDTPHCDRKVSAYDELAFLSQVEHGRCYNEAIRWWRHMKSKKGVNTMGVLYWQLNDVWVGPSWSTVEKGGRWKVGHYFSRRFYSPVILTLRLTARNITVEMNSDLLEDLTGGILQLQIVNLRTGKQAKKTVSRDVNVTALSSSEVLSLSLEEITKISWWTEGNDASQNTLEDDCDALTCFVRGSITFDQLYHSEDAQAGFEASRMQLLVLTGEEETGAVASARQMKLQEDMLLHNPIAQDQVGIPKVKLVSIVDEGAAIVRRLRIATLRRSALITLSVDSAPALWLFLESSLQGYFSQNAIAVIPGELRKFRFFSFEAFSDLSSDTFVNTLQASLQYRHFQHPAAQLFDCKKE